MSMYFFTGIEDPFFTIRVGSDIGYLDMIDDTRQRDTGGYINALMPIVAWWKILVRTNT